MSHDCRVCNVLKFGKKAIVEVFLHNFPFALQLRCFIHLRRNVEQKLCSIGIPRDGSYCNICFWLAGFFWAAYSEGLVDSGSEKEFDTALWRLENHLWKTLCDSKWVTSFFCQYQANVVKYHMSWDVIEADGFESPPSTFTTNSSESKNVELKWMIAIYSSWLNHREMKSCEQSLVEVNTVFWPSFSSSLFLFTNGWKYYLINVRKSVSIFKVVTAWNCLPNL